MESSLTLDLNNLTETERQVICNVLKRDDDLRRRDEQRIQRLKSELQWIRRRGAIRGGVDPMTSCARCRCKLGKIINRGSPCPVCKVAKVCKACRVYARDGVHWFCVVCHKQLEIEAATGEWMNDFMRRASRHKDRKGVPPADVVRETISRNCSSAAAAAARDNRAASAGDNHGKGGQRRRAVAPVAITASLNRDPRETSSLMDGHQGKASALSSVSPELSLPPSPEISRSPRSPPRDRSPPSSPSSHRHHHRPSSPPPVPSPRQKSPLLKQRAVLSEHDTGVDQAEPPTVSQDWSPGPAPPAAPRRRAAPGVPHHPSDRSDSGIGPESATPLTPRSPKAHSTYSESVHSRQSSSCSSGRFGGGDASWSFRTTTTTTNDSVATDSVSELSDSEVEPSTRVVFRKVSLKRRKHKDGRHASYGQCCPLVVDESSSPFPSSSSSRSSCPRHPEPSTDVLLLLPPLPLTFSAVPVPSSEPDLIRTNSDDCFWWAGGDIVKETADVRATFLRSFLSSSSTAAAAEAASRSDRPTPLERLSRSLEDISSSSSIDSDHRQGLLKDFPFPAVLSSSWTSGDPSVSGRWNDIWLDSPDYEEDFLPDCCVGGNASIVARDSCSDILCNVHDKIVPEGSEYRIVFISSSSSKSSGLNSGCDECPSSPSVLLMDECDDDDWEVRSAVTDSSPPPLPLAPPPVLPPGALLIGFSPTCSIVDGDVDEYTEMTNGSDVTSPVGGGVPFDMFRQTDGDLCSSSSVSLRGQVSDGTEVQAVDSDEPESGLGTLFSDMDLTTAATEHFSENLNVTSEDVSDVEPETDSKFGDNEMVDIGRDTEDKTHLVVSEEPVDDFKKSDEADDEPQVDLLPLETVAVVRCEEEEVREVQALARPIADLHQLIAQSRALRDSGQSTDHQNLEESTKTSVLEKYFVTTLEQTAPKSGRLHRPHLLKSVSLPVSVVREIAADESNGQDVSESDDSDESTDDSDNCDDSTNGEEDSETTAFDSDDSESTLSSTSSDEGTVYLKMTPAAVSGQESAFRNNLDMSLHTIVEESCEESESERPAEERNSRRRDAAARISDPSELERYYRYTFGGNMVAADQSAVTSNPPDDTSAYPAGNVVVVSRPKDCLELLFSDDGMSDTGSSCFSENNDDMDGDDDELARLASSRLEKYFLTGFLGMDAAFGLTGVAVVTAAAAAAAASAAVAVDTAKLYPDEAEEIPFAKNDGCDTIKRKTKKDVSTPCQDLRSEEVADDVLRSIARIMSDVLDDDDDGSYETKDLMISEDDRCRSTSTMDTSSVPSHEEEEEDPNRFVPDNIGVGLDDFVKDSVDVIALGPTAEKDSKWDAEMGLDSPYLGVGRSLNLDWKQQSRDSGFIGSSDDLLIRERELEDEGEGEEEEEEDDVKDEEMDAKDSFVEAPPSCSNPAVALSTVSSSSSIFGQFRGSARSTRSNRSVRSNFCTSDDEAHYIVNQLVTQIAKSMSRSPQLSRAKPPEIEVFEEELTKLMQSVPGIDATVKELVEELSSTDYCSDSYESSEYTSSDQETHQTTSPSPFTFEVHRTQPLFPVVGSGGGIINPLLRRNDSWRSSTSTASKTSSLDGGQLSSEETMFIYQRFMDSLTKMAEHVSDDTESSKSGGARSPPTFTKIVTHIRDKVTSLMREVQGSPKLGGEMDPVRHRRKIVWRKPGSGCGDELSSISSTTSSMTFDSEDSPTDTELSIDSDDPTAAGTLNAALNQAKAIAVEMSGLTTPTGMTPEDDEAARSSSTSDGLERWNSDMTIVDGDDDVRFTSVHKSEPMLSIPDDCQTAEDKRHSLSFDNQLASRIGSTGFASNSLQQRHHSADDRPNEPGSSASLFDWSKEADQRKCRSEWEMWKASSDSVVDSSRTLPTGVTPTHKSCDLLPSSVRCKTEPKTHGGGGGGLYHQHGTTTSKDRRKHGLTTFIWRQKSGSSTSLREASESVSAKQQIQYRSSHQLQSAKKKDEHQQRYHWPFGSNSSGHKHKDSKWSSSVKSCLSSPESLSGVGVDATATVASVVDTLSDDSDGVRLLSHRSLDTANNPILKAHPLGHRTMPSSASSTHKTPSFPSSINQPPSSSSSWAKASTLPRAAGPSDLSFVPNASFLHKSNRCLLTTAANNKYSRLLSSHLPHPRPDPHSWSWTTSPAAAAATVTSRPVPEQDLRRQGNTLTRQSQPQQPPIAAPRQLPVPRSSTTTAASSSAGVVAAAAAAATTTTNLESPKFRREVRSWPDENSSSMEPARNTTVAGDPHQIGGGGGHRSSKPVLATPVDGAKYIPNISVVEFSEKNSPRGIGVSDMAEEDIDRLVALHKNRSLSSLGVCSESMSSVYSAAGGGHYGNVTVRGEVEFGLGYNYVSGALEVSVKQCRDLASVDIKRSRSDPYVKVYLLPDKSKSGKRKTRVKKHTLNPTFNEVLKFNVTISELETRTLWLTVWHSDMFGRNEFLGEVTLPMGYEAFDDSSSKWYLLRERLGPPEEVFSYKGDLVVALRFVPPDVTNQKKGQRSKGSLHVLVKEARNLMAVSANGTSDPFCKCYLLPDRSKSNKQKTPVVKRSCHPKWNHTFVYEDVSLESLWERCLEITVWDYDRLTSNDFLGGVRLSLGTGKYQGKKVDWMDSRGEEVSVWQIVLERPNVWVDSSLLLRPTMDHRQTSTL